MEFAGKNFRLLAVSFIFSFLTACSDGADPNNAPPPIEPAGSSLSGNSQLGNIIGGIVTILDIEGNLLATSTTDNDGNYGPVTIPSTHSGPIIVEITPAGDGSSFFVCDFPLGCPDPAGTGTIPFGDLVPYTATLSAVLPDESSVNAANVNAITTAIRARAEMLGLSSESIVQADQEMSTALTDLLGVPIPTNIPTLPSVDLVNGTIADTEDATNEAASVNLGNLNAGLISLITPTSGFSDIDGVVASLATGFATSGEFAVSDDFNTGDVQAGELLFATEQQITTLAEEQPEVFAQVQAIAPENDLDELAGELADSRNEIAPVPPVISGVAPTSVQEDSTYSFTPTATDPDGDTLTFLVTGQPEWMNLNTSTGQLSGTPGNDDVGTTSGILLSVTDGTSTTSLPSFDVTVENTNDAPVISGTADTSVNQDQPYSFAPSATDIDIGDTLMFSMVNNPGWLQIDTLTGLVTGTPQNGDVGTTSPITISVSDGEISSSLPAFTINVININDAPSLSGTPPTEVTEDEAYTFSPLASDIDPGATLTFTATSLPGFLSINTATGVVTGTPNDNDVGNYSNIIISVTDDQGATTSLPGFNLTVINIGPTISGNPPASTPEDIAFSFTPTATGGIAFSIENMPAWASFDTSTGTLSGTPTNDNVGNYQNIIITVSDSVGSSSLAAFNLEVTNVNDDPLISGTPDTTVDEDSPYSFTPTASDVDANDVLTFTVENSPPWTSFDAMTGTLSGTPLNANVGLFNNIIISVSDGSVSVPLAPFDITVNNTNDAPTISGAPLTSINESSNYSFVPTIQDVDVGDTTTVSIVNLPSWMNFNSTTGEISGTPADGDVGTYLAIMLTVEDIAGASSTLAAFDVTVVNVPPTISGSLPAATQDVAYSFTPTSSGAASFQATNLPAWASINSVTGEVTGTPTNDDVGTTSNITIEASDINETVSLTNLELVVINVNDLPTLVGTPPEFAFVDSAYSFALTANDIDGDTLLYTSNLSSAAPWASLDTTNPLQPTIVGTPASGDVGTTLVSVFADDQGFPPASPVEYQYSLEVVAGTFVTLEWDNPTTFADGTALAPSDLSGFEITYTPEGGTPVVDLVNTGPGGATTWTSPLLSLGTYTFTVRVFDTNSDLSGPSNSLNAVFNN